MQIEEEKIKIIITDDHSLFRQGLITALAGKKNIQVIAEAHNGLDLLQKLEYHKPDMIMLNFNMPFMNGLETLPKLKEKYPGIK
ncbi:MAG: response regulator transcription factor [Chitinophagaceae bacterium]|nr:response regulator transcription factor [Chitinophagaceae bacterium]